MIAVPPHFSVEMCPQRGVIAGLVYKSICPKLHHEIMKELGGKRMKEGLGSDKGVLGVGHWHKI